MKSISLKRMPTQFLYAERIDAVRVPFGQHTVFALVRFHNSFDPFIRSIHSTPLNGVKPHFLRLCGWQNGTAVWGILRGVGLITHCRGAPSQIYGPRGIAAHSRSPRSMSRSYRPQHNYFNSAGGCFSGVSRTHVGLFGSGQHTVA
jgi:hypothetical protein